MPDTAIFFPKGPLPAEMGDPQSNAFVTHFAVRRLHLLVPSRGSPVRQAGRACLREFCEPLEP